MLKLVEIVVDRIAMHDALNELIALHVGAMVNLLARVFQDDEIGLTV